IRRRSVPLLLNRTWTPALTGRCVQPGCANSMAAQADAQRTVVSFDLLSMLRLPGCKGRGAVPVVEDAIERLHIRLAACVEVQLVPAAAVEEDRAFQDRLLGRRLKQYIN